MNNLALVSNFRDKGPLIISVTSGKGGVGKTLTTINFALSAAQKGWKVLILDGDLGLANVDVVLGLRAKYNINDVFAGLVSLADIILEGPFGIRVIPTGSGIAQLHALSYIQKQILFEQIKELPEKYDLFLIDTGAGIGDNVLHLNALSHRRVVVTTSEPHAMTDAYAVIKVLHEEKGINSFDLILNMVRSSKEAQTVARSIKDVAERFLGVDVNYLGYIPQDSKVNEAILRRAVATQTHTQTLAGQAWRKIADDLYRHFP